MKTKMEEVKCPKHGRRELSAEQYRQQLESDHWFCPECGAVAQFVERA